MFHVDHPEAIDQGFLRSIQALDRPNVPLAAEAAQSSSGFPPAHDVNRSFWGDWSCVKLLACARNDFEFASQDVSHLAFKFNWDLSFGMKIVNPRLIFSSPYSRATGGDYNGYQISCSRGTVSTCFNMVHAQRFR